MAEWVTLHHIFDVCARNTGYEEGGKLRVPWRRQAAVKKQLNVTVEYILATASVRRGQEYGRSGERKGGSEGESTDS